MKLISCIFKALRSSNHSKAGFATSPAEIRYAKFTGFAAPIRSHLVAWMFQNVAVNAYSPAHRNPVAIHFATLAQRRRAASGF